MQAVTFTTYRFDRAATRAWAFAQMGPARFALARVPGLSFFRLCGSGTGEGFTPVPNLSVYAILGVWSDGAAARAGLAAPVFRRYAARAAEVCTWHLRAERARGRWVGRAPFEGGAEPRGPVAALTRATRRPRILARFWGRVPAISDVIGADPNVLYKIGVGELPWVRQVTFSVWPSVAAMDAFARRGPHQEAIARVRAERWFSEELYARFAIDAVEGTWDGRAPLSGPVAA